MKYFLSICASVLAIVALVISIFVVINKNRNKPAVVSFGDVSNVASYSTSTDQFAAVTVGATKLLKNGSGVLRNVLITNETAGSFNLYDATSTNHGNHATTTLAKIYASLAEETYEYNIVFSRGLLVEFQSTNIASSTITWD